MRIKKKNVTRLASLSALGAGALGITAGTAEAGNVVYNTIGSNNIVYGDGSGNHALAIPVGTKSINLKGIYSAATNWASWFVKASGAGFQFKTTFAGGPKSSNLMKMMGAGVKWATAGGSQYNPGVIARRGFSRQYAGRSGTVTGLIGGYMTSSGTWSGPSSTWVKWGSHMTGSYRGTITPGHSNFNTTHFNAGNFSDKFALFQFTGGGSPIYGWLKLSSEVTNDLGPKVTVTAWAYDTSGAQLASGDIGDTSTPEPSTLGLTSLAALALGADGLRRWRAARKKAA